MTLKAILKPLKVTGKEDKCPLFHWNYRVFHSVDEYGTDCFFVHETHYDRKNRPIACTAEPDLPFGETMKELAGDMRYFAKALKKPILTIVKKGKAEKIVPWRPKK